MIIWKSYENSITGQIMSSETNLKGHIQSLLKVTHCVHHNLIIVCNVLCNVFRVKKHIGSSEQSATPADTKQLKTQSTFDIWNWANRQRNTRHVKGYISWGILRATPRHISFYSVLLWGYCAHVSTWPRPLRIGNSSKSGTITLRAITLVITQWGGRSDSPTRAVP